MLTPKQIAENGTFLVNEVGSSVHGTNLDGVDDLDLMGVCFQPPSYVLGTQHFEQYIYRTAEERARFNPEGNQKKYGGQPPSMPGDIDLVIYSVQKYLKLALDGNPNVIVLLYSSKHHPEYHIDSHDNWQRSFYELAPHCASRRAGVKFLGYLHSQRERLLGRRGQMRVTRTDLIEKYGYDTKYAMQACRLGLQGIEFMQTGKLTLPMPKPQADTLKAVREGAFSLAEVIDWIDRLEKEVTEAIDSSQLPNHPNVTAIDAWLSKCQMEFFHWLNSQQDKGYKAKLP